MAFNTFYIVVLVLGIFFTVSELFLPSGILGAIGIFLISVALIQSSTSVPMLVLFSILCLSSVIVLAFFTFQAFKRGNFLIHSYNLTGEHGYNSKQDHSDLVGKHGTVLTTLRPSGKILILGKQYDAISEANFIEKGEPITVLRIENNNIVVNRTD